MSPVIEHSQSEHQEMERLLDEVMKCAPGSEQQTSALGRLRQTIEHHAEEEEDRIFTQATDVLNNEQKKSLDAEFHALKQREKERLTEMSH